MPELYDEDDELSIQCIKSDISLVMLKVAIEIENHVLSHLPEGTVLYLLEKRDDGFCRVKNAPNAEPFLVPTAKVMFV